MDLLNILSRVILIVASIVVIIINAKPFNESRYPICYKPIGLMYIWVGILITCIVDIPLLAVGGTTIGIGLISIYKWQTNDTEFKALNFAYYLLVKIFMISGLYIVSLVISAGYCLIQSITLEKTLIDKSKEGLPR